MGREYYYKPPEWTKERMRDIFVAFNDDIPITEFSINRFFIDALEVNHGAGMLFVNTKTDEMIPNMAKVYDHKTGEYSLEKRMTPASMLTGQEDVIPDSDYTEELNMDVIEALLDGIVVDGTLSHFVVQGGCGDTLIVDEDTLIALPKILMRIIE